LDYFLLRGNDFEMFFPWSLFSKGKENWCKKANNPFEGVKRRVTTCNKEFLDVVFVDSNIDILRAPPIRRGGRKMNKASHRAMCAKAVKATTPIRVDILEVGKDNFHAKSWFKSSLSMTMRLSRFFSRKGLPP
jgi:hypothetical protein